MGELEEPAAAGERWYVVSESVLEEWCGIIDAGVLEEVEPGELELEGTWCPVGPPAPSTFVAAPPRARAELELADGTRLELAGGLTYPPAEAARRAAELEWTADANPSPAVDLDALAGALEVELGEEGGR